MTRMTLLAAMMLGLVAMVATDAYAHGGAFRGPNGGVPPGLREPSDPEPPPPPPSDPGTPGGPTTPPDNPDGGPVTPPDKGGHDTPPDSGAPTPVGPSNNPQKKAAKTKSMTFENWQFWWGYNNDDILNLKESIYSGRLSSTSPLIFASKEDERNRLNPLRPTQAAVINQIIPALEARLEDPRDHEDVHGGALIALGKVGEAKYISLFKDSVFNVYKTSKGESIKFGFQATESAAIALGMLPKLDDKDKAIVRQICLEVVADDKQRTRERAWAAVALGLQRDREAVRPLMKLLEVKYSDDNVPAGILVGLGLIGDNSIVDELCTAFKEKKLAGQEVTDRVQAFIGYALMKIEDPKALDTIVQVLKLRSFGTIAKRSAAIAAGVLGAKADEKTKEDLFKTVKSFIDKVSDPSCRNFATIALSQIGTKECLEALMSYAEDGDVGQRPFAALGLATHVFYKDRDAARGGEGMNPEMRLKIVAKLGALSDKLKDTDTKAAFLLARGIVKDKSAVETLVNNAGDKSGDPLIRGFSCVALGLLGDASDNVKNAIKLALADGKKSADLRRDAATGLGLLKDARIVDTLIEELKSAKTFAVQGGLITAIGTIGDHRAITPLVEILNDLKQPAQTRALAAVGLGMIGDLRELPALARLSQNYNYRASVSDLDELLFIL
ncbi:MAG: HEAT repeat domain-containing protein [Planctomycetaceae bacterium]